MESGFNDDDGLVPLYMQVARLHFLRSHYLLEKIGLYPGQPQLLKALKQHGYMSQKQLSDVLFVKPATVNVAIQRMTKAGFIQSVSDEKDLRKTKVSLTEKGEDILTQFQKTHKQIEEECCNNLSEDEIKTMIIVLKKIQSNLTAKIEDFAALQKVKTGQ